MKKLLAILAILLSVSSTVFSQTEKIALGVLPLSKSTGVDDKYVNTMVGQIYNQAVAIKELNVVSRTPEDMKKIIAELDSTLNPSHMNSDTRAEFGKRSGATHLVMGEMTTITITKVLIKQIGFVKIYGKLANIVVNLRVVNVSTGTVEFSNQIKSDITPDPEPLTSDERVINNKIKAMGKDVSTFLNEWYNKKISSK